MSFNQIKSNVSDFGCGCFSLPSRTHLDCSSAFLLHIHVVFFVHSLVHWGVCARTVRVSWDLPVWTWLGRTWLLQWWVLVSLKDTGGRLPPGQLEVLETCDVLRTLQVQKNFYWIQSQRPIFTRFPSTLRRFVYLYRLIPLHFQWYQEQQLQREDM